MDKYIENDQLSPVFTLLAGGISILEVPQLKIELVKRGLITSGTESELKTRLIQYLNGESLPADFTPFEQKKHFNN